MFPTFVLIITFVVYSFYVYIQIVYSFSLICYGLKNWKTCNWINRNQNYDLNVSFCYYPWLNKKPRNEWHRQQFTALYDACFIYLFYLLLQTTSNFDYLYYFHWLNVKWCTNEKLSTAHILCFIISGYIFVCINQSMFY